VILQSSTDLVSEGADFVLYCIGRPVQRVGFLVGERDLENLLNTGASDDGRKAHVDLPEGVRGGNERRDREDRPLILEDDLDDLTEIRSDGATRGLLARDDLISGIACPDEQPVSRDRPESAPRAGRRSYRAGPRLPSPGNELGTTSAEAPRRLSAGPHTGRQAEVRRAEDPSSREHAGVPPSEIDDRPRGKMRRLRDIAGLIRELR